MQFVLESVSDQGVRMGKLLWRVPGKLPTNPAIGSNHHTVKEALTPLCLLYTRGGSVPHLTPDIVEGVVKLLRSKVTTSKGQNAADSGGRTALLTLPTLYEVPGREVLSLNKEGIHRFLNMQDHLLYLSVQDPSAPPLRGYNEDKKVSIWTKGGRSKITVTDHLKFVEALCPNVFEALCDSVSSDSNKMKRMKKSVDRTLKFLDETIAHRSASKVLQECSLLGAIEGSDILEERKRSAIETTKRPVDGFVLEGFDLEHRRESLEIILSSTTKLLPEDKPRFIHGLYSPGDIFTALESGVDVFESSYPYTASERGQAVTFTNALPKGKKGSLQCDSEKEDGKDVVNDIGGGGVTGTEFEINLEEDRYSMDFRPILLGCECYTCANHTRAYIHHLLITKEILARVLLMTHNLTHYLLFFYNLRMSLKTSTYVHFKEACLERHNL